ncbi:MAG: glycoside hydrolase family 2 [Planctomycetes bacterium]|nr:glycoside hydrolase family 2 [Planctomycetota bacterium]
MLTALFATLLVTALPALERPASPIAAEPAVHAAPAAHAWAPKHAALMTRWAAQVDPKAPLPEYPRPQMARAEWQNLNGIWQFQPGAAGDATPTGKTLSSEILVPYPVESALSGVMEHHERLWYRRTFTVPAAWKGRQVMLNFGAVDYEAQVFVNGQSVGTHTGGYEEFSYDIAPFLKGDGPQELLVRVFDSTGRDGQPRGKQTTTAGGVMYTSTTGIWQTVWLEPVAASSIASLHLVPDVDKGVVIVTISAPAATATTQAIIQIRDGGNVVGTVTAMANDSVSIPIPNAKAWSPDSPFLYDVNVTLQNGKTVMDQVSSYFGMRKISLGQDGGFTRMLLNNTFVFQMGPLDQGFWPDGIYTAPTDEALRSDIEAEKLLGFNMVRKHIKVEPARWYYWADKLGILVWQDMPSPASATDKPAFAKQLVNMIQSHWNSPAIIMWVIFNESGGRHDTAELVNKAKALDPSRLVNRDSGAGYESDAPGEDGKIGDVDDVHSYPPPAHPAPDAHQAAACGEYGGIGHLLKGHLYRGDDFAYETYTMAATQEDLHDGYGVFTAHLKDYRENFGLSAAVYTEITDVETEINGLLSYDRVLKVDPARIRLANALQYVLPTYQAILPTSQTASQSYKYVFAPPAPKWSDMNFDDSAWMSGPGGFGTGAPGAGLLGTVWNTPDVWLRRNFTLPKLSSEALNKVLLADFHDDDFEVYLNGVLAYRKTGYIFRDYEYSLLSDAAKAALVVGGDNMMAVHCHQLTGGQYVDVGLVLKVPAAGK